MAGEKCELALAECLYESVGLRLAVEDGAAVCCLHPVVATAEAALLPPGVGRVPVVLELRMDFAEPDLWLITKVRPKAGVHAAQAERCVVVFARTLKRGEPGVAGNGPGGKAKGIGYLAGIGGGRVRGLERQRVAGVELPIPAYGNEIIVIAPTLSHSRERPDPRATGNVIAVTKQCILRSEVERLKAGCLFAGQEDVGNGVVGNERAERMVTDLSDHL